MEKTLVKTKTRDRVFGPRPSHKHIPPSGADPWLCNSPYCNYMEAEHPDDGGLEPVQEGREPWRGHA